MSALSESQVSDFHLQGYLFLVERFSPSEVKLLRAAADEVYALDREDVWRESRGARRSDLPLSAGLWT
jgi:ectoine hydroxylase